MKRAIVALLVVGALYPPGRLFALVAATSALTFSAIRTWRRGKRLPAMGASIMILAAVAGAWHAAGAIQAFRDARKGPPPILEGTHEGAAEGLRGPIRVRVTVSRGRIEDVLVLSSADSPSIAGEALEETRRRILAAGSPRVETAHGARVSTAALCRAVEEALWSAHGPRIEGVARVLVFLESNKPSGTTFACLTLLLTLAAAAIAMVDSSP